MGTDSPAARAAAARAATRAGIVDAFSRLVLSTRRARPPVAQLLREAGVARATLYKHFDDRDAVLLESMMGALGVIADAAAGRAHGAALAALLEHFWANRANAGDVFDGASARRLARALGALLCERDRRLDRHDGARIAETLIALIRLWLAGETPSTAGELAARMVAAGHALRTAFCETAPGRI